MRLEFIQHTSIRKNLDYQQYLQKKRHFYVNDLLFSYSLILI